MKNKNKSKIVLLSGITLATMGMAGVLNVNTTTLRKEEIPNKLQAYNMVPDNILDNVYYDENYGLILPFIFNKSGQTIEKDYVIEQFSKKGLTANISSDKIATGTTITVEENDNKYTIIVFGDANGDGKVNLIDVQRIILHHLDPETKSLNDIYAIAANVNNNSDVINLVDAQRILLFHLGDLKAGLVTNPPESLQNYAKKIVPTLTKTTYNYGEAISGTVKVEYASGEIKTVEITEDMVKNYNSKQLGAQTITITYEELSVTCDITVENNISKIIVVTDEYATKGECYNSVKVAKLQAEQNEIILPGQVEFEITGENAETATAEVNEDLEVSFKAKVAGTYTITPKVGDIKGTGVQVEIKDSEVVDVISIEKAMVIKQGIAKTFDIDFKHNYTEEPGRSINVEAYRIDVVATNVEYILLDEDGNGIDKDTDPGAIVKAISVKGTSLGTGTLVIKVDNSEVTKVTSNISIQEPTIQIPEGTKNITLYLNNPNLPLVKEYVDDSDPTDVITEVYSLVEIWIEGNPVKKLKMNQLTEKKGQTSASGILVEIIDSLYSDGQKSKSQIKLKGYKLDENGDIVPVTSSGEEIDYVGIALCNNNRDLDNGTVTISYGNTNITLNVAIPANKLSKITVNKDGYATRGECYSPVTVGKLQSGKNEEKIPFESVEFEITGENAATATAEVNEDLEISFKAKKVGTYTIIPKVGDIRGTGVEVEIKDSTQVDEISIEATMKIKQGIAKAFDIDFKHDYEEEPGRSINVEAYRIDVVATNVEYILLDEEGNGIDKDTDPGAIVKAISVKGTSLGTGSISIAVDNNEETKVVRDITISEPTIQIPEGTENITLYLSNPNLPLVKEYVDDSDPTDVITEVYSLLEISIEGNPVRKLTMGELTEKKGQTNPNGILVEIIDSLYGSGQKSKSQIKLKGYKTNENGDIVPVDSQGEPIDYIGIALSNSNKNLNNGTITISYGDTEIPLDVIVKD